MVVAGHEPHGPQQPADPQPQEHERKPQPQRVREHQDGSPGPPALGRREGQDPRQDGPDARGPPGGEGHPQGEGAGGTRAIESRGFIAAAFRHRISRAGDPLLHTHVLVANLIYCADERWGALDARRLYLQAKTAGYLYQAHLRGELTRRLGVEWSPVRKGSAEIEGIGRRAIRAFSTRRREIETLLEKRPDATRREAEIAALRIKIDRAYNPRWGSLFREGNESSRFGHQLKDFACVYTSRVSNFLHYPWNYYFQSPVGYMPHDI